LWRCGVKRERIEGISGSRSLEPWLAGDRQTLGRMAKAGNPLQSSVSWKSVYRELPNVALVASQGRV
jgi:hypothetical protein